MQTLVLLTTATIEESLRDLPFPWSVNAAQPAGSMRERGRLEGSVGAWLDFYGIVRDLEPPEAGASAGGKLESAPSPREIARATSAPLPGELEREAASASLPAELEREAASAPLPAELEREVHAPPPQQRRIVAIEYEAHPEMAQHQLELLARRIAAAHELQAILVIHRIGRVPVGDSSLLVRTLSGHRGESLRACAELIDELKKWVPIWKHPISA